MGLGARAAVGCALCWHALTGCAPAPPPTALVRDRAVTCWAERWSDGDGDARLGDDSLWLGGPERREARLRFALPPRQALGRAQLVLHTTASWPGAPRPWRVGVRVEDARPSLLRPGRRDGLPVYTALPQARDRALSWTLDDALERAWAARAEVVWLRVALDDDSHADDARVPVASPSHPDRNRRPRLLLY